MPRHFPTELRTHRLILRPWRPTDAARLKTAIDANLAHLQAWMPWAMNEPSSLEEVEQRIGDFEQSAIAGTEWSYGSFFSDGETVVGGAGIHARIDQSGLEIGYWIDQRLLHTGYATEAAQALTDLVLSLPEIDHVEIHCDPRHTASAAVAMRLGYTLVETRTADALTPTGEPRDSMIWRLSRTPVAADPRFTFRRVTDEDLPLLHDWLHRPHVVRWWPDRPTLAEVEAKYSPGAAGRENVESYLALLDGVPVGYIQSYVVAGNPGNAGNTGGWWPNETDPGARGIDQYLADPAALGRGLGTAMVRQFVALLFEDPAVTKIQTDPHPTNVRAVRCYDKAGFRRVGEVVTPDGPALLMTVERPPG